MSIPLSLLNDTVIEIIKIPNILHKTSDIKNIMYPGLINILFPFLISKKSIRYIVSSYYVKLSFINDEFIIK